MRGIRFSSLPILVLAIVATGLWAGCSDMKTSKLLLPQHGAQTTPSGEYALAWTDVEVLGAGRVVLPGEPDLVLPPERVKDLAHSLLNIDPTGRHGVEVTPLTGADGAVSLVVDPHPHGAARIPLSYDKESGRAEGYFVPVTFTAPSAALNTLMREFIVRATGIPNPQDVNVTKFEIEAVTYSFHWKPDALEVEPAEIAYPSLMTNGLMIEGTFFEGETQGSFSATITRMVADARGVQVTECPECVPASMKPGGRPPIGVDP